VSEARHAQRFRLGQLSPASAVLLSAQVGKAARGAPSLEEAARAIVRTLYESLWDPLSERSELALVRFYRTIAFRALDRDLQEVATAALGDDAAGPPKSDLKCLTLMASAGVEEAWNSRHTSLRHRAIPLSSKAAVARLPMVSRLIRDLGVSVDALIEGSTPATETDPGRAMLHIEEAEGSPAVPDQDSFVRLYGIRSVVGLGGSLQSGDFWAVVIFTRVPLEAEKARLLRVLTSDIKIAVLPVLTRRLFAA